MDPKNRKLFEWATYEWTDRLRMLATQETSCPPSVKKKDWPNAHDVLELWEQYKQGNEEVGANPTISEFAHWILGTPEFFNGERFYVN